MARALPIEPLLPTIRAALAERAAVVLQAAPGAGKTTLVPPALLEADWLRGQSIVMLEPRRLATRASAERMAELRGEQVGGTVGYRMRGDSRVDKSTRIEVVTEGVLTRRLQRDPTLDGVGLLIFDEFHERSLDADLGLALALHTRSLVRDDLRLLVMSATLDGTAVAALLGDAPVITSEGREFPVQTRHVTPRADARMEAAVAGAITTALRDDDGDILVFLPGAGEIRRVEALLHERSVGDTLIVPLFGALSREEQDRAILPDARGRRKVVLATSIAETSLTIEGIRVVIDSGYSRVPRFSPATGMTRLETVRVSRASADQRRGRAGRLGPGICYRLWPEHESHHLLASAPPEITNADLAPLALDLAAAGVMDPLELQWLDAPAPAAYAQARELLEELDALDSRGHLTAHGREMAALPVHPRLAHMLLHARRAGTAPLACRIAALLSERDVFRSGPEPADADVALRFAPMTRSARTQAERLARHLGVELRDDDSLDHAGELLALAYPDRVARRREGERPRFLLRNGRGAELVGAQSLGPSPFLVAAELDDRRPESRIFLAAAVDEASIRELFASQIESEDVVEIDDASRALLARRREMLGAIVLRDVATGNPDAAAVARAWTEYIARHGVAELPWSDAARRTRERMAFVARHDAAWPDVSDAVLGERMAEWLTPLLGDVKQWRDLERADLNAALLGLLDWTQRRALDELAPTHIEVPTGSRIAVDYGDPAAPVLAVRVQEVFGLTESPRVLGGRVPVTMHLLSPAHRPVQVTRDLAGFWRTSYFDVRKDLRGRYPKHEWPENPLDATPTRRAKPRK